MTPHLSQEELVTGIEKVTPGRSEEIDWEIVYGALMSSNASVFWVFAEADEQSTIRTGSLDQPFATEDFLKAIAVVDINERAVIEDLLRAVAVVRSNQ